MISSRRSRNCCQTVRHLCSRPGCGQATCGPQEHPAGAVNLGVAAHITAAAPGGPRYDSALTQLERASADNGIWLCQTCAKLIDNDIARYPAETLREWKRRAEAEAARALEHRRDADRHNENAVSKAMRLMPELLAEMKNDLRELPLCREFVVLKKTWTFWYPEHRVFTYYYEDHPDLDNKLRLLENLRRL